MLRFVFAVVSSAIVTVSLAQGVSLADDSDSLVHFEEQQQFAEWIPPPEYQSFTAARKQELLWKIIEKTEYSGEYPTDAPTLWQFTNMLKVAFLQQFFTVASDLRPISTPKIIHTWGSAALVEFVPSSNTPYTGLFHTGAVGLIRLSLAKPASAGFTPGLALKLLIDGKPSANFHVMPALEGQGDDTNFFAHQFTQNLKAPVSLPLKVAAERFHKAVEGLGSDGTGRLLSTVQGAQFDRDGNAIAEPKHPQTLALKAPVELRKSHYWKTKNSADLRHRLATIAEGTTLFNVWGWNKATGYISMGKIVLQSKFVASQFSDKRLLFQHVIDDEVLRE